MGLQATFIDKDSWENGYISNWSLYGTIILELAQGNQTIPLGTQTYENVGNSFAFPFPLVKAGSN